MLLVPLAANGLRTQHFFKLVRHTVLIYIFHIIIVKVGEAGEGLAINDLVTGLSSSAKTDIHTIIRHKFNIINEKIGKAAKGSRMRDIAFEQFVKLSQVWYF